MAKKDQNFEIYQHTDKLLTFAITDKNGAPKDLSGGSATWAVFAVGQDITLIEKKSSAGQITINQSNVSVILLDTDTDNLKGKYIHELRTVDSSGNDDISAVGTINILYSSTK